MLPRPVTSVLLAGLLAGGAFVLGRFSAHPAPRESAPLRPPPAVAAKPAAHESAKQPQAAAAVSSAERLAAALRSALAAPDRATRLTTFAQQLGALEPAEYSALLQALRRVRNPDTPDLLAMLCSAWAAHDGPGAFAAARALAGSDGEYSALHSAIGAWARRDPHAAHETLRRAGLTNLSTDEMAAFVQGWARRDAAAAEAFLATVIDGPRANDADAPAAVRRGFEAIAAGRIQADPAAAMIWYGRLPPPLQEQLRQTVLGQLAAVDPHAASAWLARDAAAEIGAHELVPVLRGLQLTSLEQQFAWAGTAANPQTRRSALHAVVQEAAHANLVGLGEWLAVRADDSGLAPAFSAYATQVVHKSPNAAVTWALSLDQPALRQQALNTVAAEWSTVNPRAAREWAQRTGLVDWDSLAR